MREYVKNIAHDRSKKNETYDEPYEIDLSEEHEASKKNRSEKRNHKDKDYRRKYEDDDDGWN